ncbi:uncharacterized protein ACOB8E_018476 [Sarcophilus harrisii]
MSFLLASPIQPPLLSSDTPSSQRRSPLPSRQSLHPSDNTTPLDVPFTPQFLQPPSQSSDINSTLPIILPLPTSPSRLGCESLSLQTSAPPASDILWAPRASPPLQTAPPHALLTPFLLTTPAHLQWSRSYVPPSHGPSSPNIPCTPQSSRDADMPRLERRRRRRCQNALWETPHGKHSTSSLRPPCSSSEPSSLLSSGKGCPGTSTSTQARRARAPPWWTREPEDPRWILRLPGSESRSLGRASGLGRETL